MPSRPQASVLSVGPVRPSSISMLQTTTTTKSMGSVLSPPSHPVLVMESGRLFHAPHTRCDATAPSPASFVDPASAVTNMSHFGTSMISAFAAGDITINNCRPGLPSICHWPVSLQ
ncbi:hypothetical protein BDR05DRAFT_969038 [Suillus weaverae]|nr:hypothetical protein BDR05DRAFT_969038 [Suillus weaverae]